MPNKLSQFWQELKRRNVHRLMAIYAGSAYVVFEASTLIFPRWGLPDWSIDMVLYLLILGAIITFVIGWIYDITPEGVRKTKPVSEAQEGEVPSTPNGWKIASLISMLVIVVLIVLNIIPRINNKEILDKSIAILPFHNDSPDLENEFIINGVMTSILDNLCKIKDLRVISRETVEQYRDNPNPISEIADELNVSYFLVGSGQKYGDNLRLTAQLMDANEKILWSQPYDRKISSVEDLISLQSEIAQMVASEIETIITPEEKELIEKIPTSNLTAYYYYQRGREAFFIWKGFLDEEALKRAEKEYNQALKYDSTYAAAYSGLAEVYLDKYYWRTLLSENFLDSVLILTDKALSYDDQISYSYSVRGEYYRAKGKPEHAIKEFEKAIKLDPNDWYAYYRLGATYWRPMEDHQRAIVNLHEALIRNRGKELPIILDWLGTVYMEAGFPDKAMDYLQETLKLNGDSASYFRAVGFLEFTLGNFNNALEMRKRAFIMDTTAEAELANMMLFSSFLGYNDEAFLYAQKYVKRIKETGSIALRSSHRIAYAFWQVGKHEEANSYFNQQIKYGDEAIELGLESSFRKAIHYDIAATYAFLGDKAKAYQYLDEFNKKLNYASWWLPLIKNDPLFDSIRDEPEFQQIVLDVESKYQAEHERVRILLEENDML